MIIVADQNLPLLEQTFGRHAEVRRRPGRQITRGDLAGAEALLVKSVTRVDARLLEETDIRFVGSATIGRDHLDTRWLSERGITWANAPGCNANAAAEYSLAMILLAMQRMARPLSNCTAGIIGRGNVGSRVLRLLQTLGVPCVACDPPLADAGTPGLVSMAEALASDIVCLHVPLTSSGPYPTRHLIGADALARLPDGALLLNSARGDVVAGPDLLAEIRQGRLQAALDVWPGEPDVDADLLDATLVATPHVAGYSVQGKVQGVWSVYQAFCRWQGVTPDPAEGDAPEIQCLAVAPTADAATAAVIGACGVVRDDRMMREQLGGAGTQIASAFDRLRKNYPDRHEFRYWQIKGAAVTARSTLRSLGFHLPSD